MFFLYSIILTIAFLVLLPRFLFDALFSGKYSEGFFQRLGFYPQFETNQDQVIWVHCVSVGEVNAARPLIERLTAEFPTHRVIVSTTTRTGQKLAREVLADQAELVFYFPFDWKFSVRRALRRFRPAVVLLMETEIWFNFIRETHRSGARLAIVNGRLSERSYQGYRYIRPFLRRLLVYPDLALMQANADAERLIALGIAASKVSVTGNIKFDQDTGNEAGLTTELRERFCISADAPLIIAASTHGPEEKWMLEAFRSVCDRSGQMHPRLMIAPRHPDRSQTVADEVGKCGFSLARRSEPASEPDKTAEVILLDSIGELRAAYPLAEIVFVGGSLISHGGQSVLEPAAVGKAIITGPYTANFDAAVTEFLEHDALIQLPALDESEFAGRLAGEISDLLANVERRRELGAHASAVIEQNRGAAARTVEYLRPLLTGDGAR